jgi:hypothetical protein
MSHPVKIVVIKEKSKQEAHMEYSTKVTQKIAEILVGEMERMGLAEGNIQEMETGLREMLQQVGAATLGLLLEKRDESENRGKRLACECGGEQRFLFRREAKIVSVFGRVRYRRRYFRCADCGRGQSPLDGQVGVEPGQVTSGLSALLALIGVQVAFEEAARVVERLLLVSVSDNTVRQETERFGALQQAQEAEWQTQSQDLDWLQARQRQARQSAPERVYGSLDGTMVPLHGEWREMKNLAWYRVEPIRSYQERRHHASRVGEQNNLQAQDIHYYCDIQTAQDLDQLFWATACRHQADIAKEVVFIGDGAAWIWNLIARHFPNATQILDWYHASEYLPPIAQAAFGLDTPAYRTWLEQARTLLWEGQIDDLLNACQSLAKGAATEAVNTAVSYYLNNRHRMDYPRFRQQGYFIGSGTVESAGKQIAGLRLKRAGARWTETGAVQTAKARAAWLSGDWDALTQARAALPLAI